ncbi:hypothetical protein VE23_20405 [Paenibacillus sp. D9]|nr:hypothetical protein VE23_20405 [Paenibacillus sp. D9]
MLIRSANVSKEASVEETFFFSRVDNQVTSSILMIWAIMERLVDFCLDRLTQEKRGRAERVELSGGESSVRKALTCGTADLRNSCGRADLRKSRLAEELTCGRADLRNS